MKDKLLQIRVDDEFLAELNRVTEIIGAKSASETVRKIVKKSLDTRLHNDLTWTHQQLSDFDLVDYELNDAFASVGIMVRAKINRLCNEEKYEEALMLEGALSVIFSQDYNLP